MATIQKTFHINTSVQQMFEPLTGPADRRCCERSTRTRLTGAQSIVTCTLIALLLSGLALLLAPGSHALAAAGKGSDGYVRFVLVADRKGEL